MITFKGTKVVSGIAIGKLFVYRHPDKHISRTPVEDTEAQLRAFHEARSKSIEQLEQLYESSVTYLGEFSASIFVAQEMLLEDKQYIDYVEEAIKGSKYSAPYAVALASDEFSRLFTSIEDKYMQSHVADVHDVSERMLRILCGLENELIEPGEPCIIASDDFNAGDIVQFNRENVLGFATMFGSPVSHASILAGTMGLPSVVGLGQEMLSIYDGRCAILNGIKGELIIDPDKRTLERMKRKQKEYEEQQRMLLLLKGKNNVTKSGAYINVYANIGNAEGVETALAFDAGGIGLFRSEFIYMESPTYPSEEEQFLIYREVLEKMRGRKVIIRTLDLGTDKQASYFRPEKEVNPALGYRAIRISLAQPELFKTQLRALYRASAFGNLDILFPLIISVDEVLEIKKIIKEITDEFDEKNIEYRKEMRLGVMIETPAAVMISDELAKHVDFFSIGTNDLTQYTLAIDRQNPKLETYFNKMHPAVFKMIEMTVANAHKAGIPVDICGEAAADLTHTQDYINLGIDALSVAPNMVLPLRKVIRECD
ncbi:MAG: phosphoenolpyruvate--protein phosphotransferase [Lachnospiraceae bacterium]|nr:phosphoenolpyruvate--protein phosphotransferase [Lachnospiraceae bacterium]